MHVKEKIVKIHKVTAVWLLQKGEKVLSDKLLCVCSKQLYTKTKNLTEDLKNFATVPHTSEVISMGDFLCFLVS